MPWGTHFCFFYETDQDLLDTLVPYFKAGLEDGEYCLWVVSRPLTRQKARCALEQAIPGFARYEAESSIEILTHDEWYLREGAFDLEGIIGACVEKLRQALTRGYPGLRLSGNRSWIEDKDRTSFCEYERRLGELIAGHPFIVLCTYPIESSRAVDVLDVARTHQVVAARRRGNWDVVEITELKEAKAKIQKLNEELERRVAERTRELELTNAELRREIAERERTEHLLAERVRVSSLGEEVARALTQGENLGPALQKCAEALVRNLDAAFARIWTVDETGRGLRLHASAGMYTRLNGKYSSVPIGNYKVGRIAQRLQPHLTNRVQEDPEVDDPVWARQEGMVSFAGYPLLVERQLLGVAAMFGRRPLSAVTLEGLGSAAGAIALGIKRATTEQALRHSQQQLRALASRLESLREEEHIRISREIHDELGQNLTGLKIDLLWTERKLGELPTSASVNSILDRVVEATELVEESINAVQRIATELRPGVLDKLGLGSALEYEARRFQERTGIRCEVRVPSAGLALSIEQRTALFRIFQECLTNVARHANATRIEAGLKFEGGCVTLTVWDNGRGITDAEVASARSLGLLGMKERASLLGGGVQWTRPTGGGTEVIVRLPQSGLPAETEGRA